MKVKELIETLSQYNPNDDVEIVGDSDGAVIQIGNYQINDELYYFFNPKVEINII